MDLWETVLASGLGWKTRIQWNRRRQPWSQKWGKHVCIGRKARSGVSNLSFEGQNHAIKCFPTFNI